MSRVKINYSLEVLNSRVIISLFYSYLSNCWYPNILEMSLAIFKWRRKENVLKKKKTQNLENNLVTLDVLDRKFRVGKSQILNLLVTGQSFKVF